MRDAKMSLSNKADIEELHARKYLIYDTESEATEALRELHENQYRILDEDAVCELKEDFNDAFSRMAGSISLVPPSFNTNPFKEARNRVPQKKSEKTKENIIDNVITDDVNIVLKTKYSTFYLDKKLDGGRACHATVIYNSETKEVIIKQGSIFSLLPAPHFLLSPQGFARRSFVNLYCEKRSDGYVLKKDTPCRSLSTAACFILGRSANAMIEWKNELGIPISELKI